MVEIELIDDGGSGSDLEFFFRINHRFYQIVQKYANISLHIAYHIIRSVN